VEEQSKDPDLKVMLDYLQANVLPEDQKEARCTVAQAPSFCLMGCSILLIVDDGIQREL